MTPGARPARRLDRPSLIERCSPATVVVLAAPGGYGKTTLAGQLASAGELATVRVPLTGPTDRPTLVAGVVRGLRRAGLSDLADAVTGFEPDEALDRLLGSLAHRQDPVLVVVDDVHVADPEAVEWLVAFVADLPARCRVVLAGRRVPDVLAGARGASTVVLGADELRFAPMEIAALLARAGDDDLVVQVEAMSAGWPAAVAVYAAGVGPRAVPSTVDRGGLLAGLVDHLLGTARGRLAPLGRLPLVDPLVAELVAGPGAYELLVDSGLPLSPRGGGWSALADPVREALATPALPAEVAGAVARAYAAGGELGTAVSWLVAEGELDVLAGVLAAEHWTSLETLGVASLKALLDLLGPQRLRRHPLLLLTASWVAEQKDPRQRRAWTALGRQLAPGPGPELRAFTAEQGRELLEDGEIDAAIATTTALLDELGAAEGLTRGRALLALGPALAISTGAARAEAADAALSEAVSLFRLAGETRWESLALQRQAFLVSFHGGRPHRALEQMQTALALLPAVGRDRALGLTYHCEIVDFVGRSAEAERLAREAFDIGRRLGDSQVVGYAAWAGAWITAHRGDLDATHRWLDEAERNPGRWLGEYAGGEFLAIAADMLAALGPDTGWQEYVERFLARADGPIMEDKTVSITSRVSAMYGDPEEAERLLAGRDSSAYAVERDRWARRLLRALAALRRGDEELARRLVREAITEVEAMGVADLPARHEGLLVSRLSAVWPAPPDGVAGPALAPVRLSLLGGFVARRGADDVTPAPGHPATLVKVLALRGPLTTDQAIDLLWPNADAATGRSRLRNLLNRIRAQTGDVVERKGESLVLSPTVVVDVTQFESSAAAALAADEVSRPGLARLALGAYHGELLPGDAYEEWAAAPRERLRRRFLALVDIATTASLKAGELDEAVRLLDAAIEVEPFGEERYVKAAGALLVQGRRATARDLVGRGVAALAELGVEPGPALATLAEQLGRSFSAPA